MHLCCTIALCFDKVYRSDRIKDFKYQHTRTQLVDTGKQPETCVPVSFFKSSKSFLCFPLKANEKPKILSIITNLSVK